jgi:hypothetical protein
MNITYFSLLFFLFLFHNSIESKCISIKLTSPCVECMIEVVTTTLIQPSKKRPTISTLPPTSTFLFNVINVRPTISTQKSKPMSSDIR